jgi:predicted dehydrogenase
MKFAIAGAGYIAAIHARAVQVCGGQVVAVIEKYPERSATFASQFEVDRQYRTVEDMVKDDKVDALVIGTPNFLHASQARAALKAGIPVLVEKPMAMNATEAEEMLQASKKSGVPLMVGHCWRFDEEVNWLKDQMHRLGGILRTKGYGVHTNWGPAGWFTEKKFSGGGALVDMGIHALDTARYLLGDPQPVSVYARIGTYYKDFDVDDTGVVIVNWDNGTTSYIESGWWQPHSDGPEATTQLFGTRGYGQLFPTQLELPIVAGQKTHVIRSGFQFPREEQCQQSMYDAQMAYFINCIQINKTPVPGGLEGLMNMKVIEAAYESSRTDKVIDVTQ